MFHRDLLSCRGVFILAEGQALSQDRLGETGRWWRRAGPAHAGDEGGLCVSVLDQSLDVWCGPGEGEE